MKLNKAFIWLAIRHHYLNVTEILNHKRRDFLSRDQCMALCDLEDFAGAGAACAALMGCIIVPIAGFVGLQSAIMVVRYKILYCIFKKLYFK